MPDNSTAMQGAADAMLRAVGGCEIPLVFPLVTLPNDPSAQLGLVDPGVQQVALAPAVVRSLEPSAEYKRRLEFLISGAAVAAALPAHNFANGEDFFAGSLGISFGGEILHIVEVIPQYCGSTPYLYKVTAVA